MNLGSDTWMLRLHSERIFVKALRMKGASPGA
jgi:hypothetical protein